MNLSRTLQFLVITIVLSMAEPAMAENSITYKKNQLEQVTWFKSRPILQIVPDGPIVHDLRHGPEQEQNYIIPLSPVSGAASSGPRMLQVSSSRLSPAGFQSNVSSRQPIGPLNQVKMGGLSPLDKVRPIGTGKPQTAHQNTFSGPSAATMRSIPAVATYARNTTAPSLPSGGQAGSQSSFSKEVLARLRNGK